MRYAGYHLQCYDIKKLAPVLKRWRTMNFPVKHTIGLAVLLFCLWLGLSGHFNIPMLTLGLLSTLFVVYISNRMDSIDPEIYPARMTPLFLRFYLFLGRAVIVANIDVVKRIFTPGKNISPQCFQVPLTMKSDLSRVIYANAITMTPGTVTLKVNKETITVHALSIEAAEDLRSGRMARAVPEDREES